MKPTSILRITRTMILGLLVFISACSPLVVEQPTGGASWPNTLPTQDSNAMKTAVAQTIQAQTPTQAPATETSVPATAILIEDKQPAATTSPAVSECQDAARYISDDSIDGTTYPPNTPFTKSWTVKNTGSCTWDDRYLVSYISGATMTQQPGYWIVPPGQTVTPGHTVNISIGMTSPIEGGNYRSYWGLKKVDAPLIPIQGGANGNSFYVRIKVNEGGGDDAGKVSAASIAIELEQGSGMACTADATYFVHAYITADGSTTASYEIDSTAGQIAAGYFEGLNDRDLSPTVSGTMVFDQADTKTISLRFVGPYPYPDNINVILRVNGGEFYNAKLSCQD
jgi:Ig-like domain from next to BRCA1 gene